MGISDDITGERWFILRTSGGNTLPLVTTLCEAGHYVWSPAHTLRRELKAATPSGTREIEVRLPILPTFAFIRAARHNLDREAQLSNLVAVGRQSPSPFPPFSVFHHAGRAPMIRDSEIAGLRQEEADKAALIQAIRDAETHAEAEAIRIAAIKSASARRRAEAAVAREERRARSAEQSTIQPGTAVQVAGEPALAGAYGVMEGIAGHYSHVRFGNHSWKIESWQVMPAATD